MYIITAEVSSDVLTEYDATLDTWEDRSEELAALIHLEDEMRDVGASAIDRRSLLTKHPTTVIEVRLDSHDHAALERVLGIGDDAGGLLTGLMHSTLSNLGESPAQLVDPLRTSA